MFTITDPGLIDTAVLLLRRPFSYASRPGNAEKFLAPHYAKNPGLERAVDALRAQHESFSSLPMNEPAWLEAVALAKGPVDDYPIRTRWSTPEADLFVDFARVVDVPLYESMSLALSKDDRSVQPTCSQDELRRLTHCVWLSSLIALCVLGVARADLDGKGVRFSPLNSVSQRALRRTWFGVAFDQISRLGDEARLEALLTNPDGADIAGFLEFFAKQWRLGFPAESNGRPNGTIWSMLKPVIFPAVRLLGASLQLSKMNRALTEDQAERIGLIDEFRLIRESMGSLAVSDRALEPAQSALTLGPLQLVAALLSVAEELARKRIDANWHGKVGHEMANYLRRRIEGTRGLRVVEVVLVQDTTTEKVPLDVDLFVIDERINRVYAIQCKHFEHSFRTDLLDWLVRFRRPRGEKRKGLDKALQQLENLPRLCREDERVRRVLIRDVGLTEAQIETIRPIIVHNLGNLDFWRTDQGICFYDLHTFCNVVKGREAAVMSIGASGVEHGGIVRDGAILDLADPDSVINAYVNDPKWQDLKQFDAMGRAQRIATVGEVPIVADGLGV
jgi:hypothetical protein